MKEEETCTGKEHAIFSRRAELVVFQIIHKIVKEQFFDSSSHFLYMIILSYNKFHKIKDVSDSKEQMGFHLPGLLFAVRSAAHFFRPSQF